MRKWQPAAQFMANITCGLSDSETGDQHLPLEASYDAQQSVGVYFTHSSKIFLS